MEGRGCGNAVGLKKKEKKEGVKDRRQGKSQRSDLYLKYTRHSGMLQQKTRNKKAHQKQTRARVSSLYDAISETFLRVIVKRGIPRLRHRHSSEKAVSGNFQQLSLSVILFPPNQKFLIRLTKISQMSADFLSNSLINAKAPNLLARSWHVCMQSVKAR